MLIKPRSVRRSSKFTSSKRTGSRHRQEIAASMYSTAAIQGMLGVGLVVAGIRAYQAISSQAPELSVLVKLALPLLFIAGGLFALRACWNNYRGVREMREALRNRDPSDGSSR